MPKLIITRGLPGSGKTTWARKWVAEDIERRARVNRDDIRAMLGVAHGQAEERVTTVRNAMIKELLRCNVDVVCDDTNLPQRFARELARIAWNADAQFEVQDMTNVSLETALLQNATRLDYKASVPDKVLHDYYQRYIRGKGYPLPLPDINAESALGDIEPYSNDDLSLPECVLVDIDGTVALMGDRDPYDETRVSEDLPNKPVVDLVNTLAEYTPIIFMSGRTKGCSDDTVRWLNWHIGRDYWSHLYMREVGDTRKDWKVKLELFNTHIRDKYRVCFVLDDRNQVVELWRALGLTCFQVAEGSF